MESSVNKRQIHKAGGILISNKRLLVERSKGKEHFIAPGGSIEPGETATQALKRELYEEFLVQIEESDLKFYDTFFAEAAGKPGTEIKMDVYTVNKWSGEPTASSEVEEIKWLSSEDLGKMKLGSIFEHDVIPKLISEGLIK